VSCAVLQAESGEAIKVLNRAGAPDVDHAAIAIAATLAEREAIASEMALSRVLEKAPLRAAEAGAARVAEKAAARLVVQDGLKVLSHF
jgi:hypothetical protein